MRKCTSFPSLVVLKHIHMFPFLLLPLLSLPFSLTLSRSLSPTLFLSSTSYFPSMKNGCGAQMDDMTRWSGVFLLLSCCWLSRLTVGRIQFGVLECVKAISTGPELLVELCANRGSRSLSTSHRLEHTHKSGEAFYRVWASFFISFPPCLPPSLLLLSLSLFLPAWENRSVLKHVLNITIFTFSCFKKAAKGECVVWIFLSFLFFLQWKGLSPGLGAVWNFKPFSCLFVLWFCRALCLH